jgi:hypothetical protein
LKKIAKRRRKRFLKKNTSRMNAKRIIMRVDPANVSVKVNMAMARRPEKKMKIGIVTMLAQ